MKICLINNLYKPYARGGAETVVALIVNGLKNEGHEVFVITTKPAAKKQKNKKTKKQNVFYIAGFYYNLDKIPKILRLFWHLLDMFDVWSYWKIKNILKKEKPDVVMTHNLKGIGYLIPRAIRKLRIKHIHTLHDIQLLHPSGLMFYGMEKSIDNALAKVYQGLCRRLFSSPDVIISPSKWLLDMHDKKGFFKISKKAVLHNPAPTPNPSPTPAERERGDKFRFLYVGLIEEHKGILFLIKAFKKINTPFIKGGEGGFELLIIGDGSKFKKAQELIGQNKNIELLGRIDNSEVKKMMQEVNCLVMPSLCYENSPTVIYEAMSFGLQVIASRIGGVPELVGSNGLLFKPNNESDLMYQMKWAVEHKDELREMGERGRQKVKKFEVEDYVKRLMNLF